MTQNVLTVNTDTEPEGATVELLTQEGIALAATVGPEAGSGGSLAPALDQIVYVSKAGNDATGDGSSTKPFLTIQAAMTSITDASPTKRYAVSLHPGRYTDPFALKANVIVVGTDKLLSQIRGAVSLDASFTPAGDHRSGFSNVLFGTVAQTFDFNTVNSNEGKLLFESVTFNTLLTLSSFSGINQADFKLCTFLGGLTQTGFVNILTGCLFQNGGAITFNGRAGQTSILGLYGGDIDGNVSIVAAAGVVALSEFGSFSMLGGALTLDGNAVSLTASPGSLPQSVTLLNGAASPRPVITGAKLALDVVMANLLAGLVTEGLITDQTT